jgi:hypothetical protein
LQSSANEDEIQCIRRKFEQANKRSYLSIPKALK